MPVISSITVDTPIGPIGVTATADGIVGTAFGGIEGTGTTNRLRAGHLAQATEELDEYFHGGRRDFTVPLDWSASAGWALTVRRCLLSSVGYGETVSYGRLAALADRPDGARAVGGILAGNPIAVLVPCHRVIASDGGLGGFVGSGGGMVETKRRLLELEGSTPPTLF